MEFKDNLGMFGGDVTSWLNDGSLTELAGDWPKVEFATSGIELVGAADSADSLKDKARKANLDCLITINVSQRNVRKAWVPTFKVTAEDLHGKIEPWESKSLSSRKAVQEGAGAILTPLEQHLKKSYRTKAMPKMSKEKVNMRLKKMKRSEDRHWLVTEIVCYYQSGKISQKLARTKLSKFAPKLDAEAVLSDSHKDRYSAVHDWLD